MVEAFVFLLVSPCCKKLLVNIVVCVDRVSKEATAPTFNGIIFV